MKMSHVNTGGAKVSVNPFPKKLKLLKCVQDGKSLHIRKTEMANVKYWS